MIKDKSRRVKPETKNIIITGTSRGIGFELVHYFGDRGHNVLALSRNERPVANLSFDNITSLAFDLHRPEDFQKVSVFVEENWNGRVDILINNAGAIINKPFAALTPTDFEQVYKTNVFGVAELVRTLLPFFKSGSHVVTISSMGGVQGSVKFPGLAAYSSSKGAVITLSELLAEEYKDSGIAFNVLALGAVQTEMLAEAFPGYRAPVGPEEMAGYIGRFALRGHRFHNGKVIEVSSSTP